ncbi:MAG: dTDP-4-dehydrorhamnose 3,5-epimerase [Pelagibacteraceae bacterium TMED124]|nr:MAG: dTDP-4-dehydrorhamnose 3,5-epimerase [Pelagibacteraceae bacterium TMED124]|tara:strand:+ start:10608 stop:11171 length:564 start_codon:yes stop_codon:yes gene_type:complete
MNVIQTNLDGVKIFEPKIFEDERGFFFESFNKKLFQESINSNIEFVQDNHSRSAKGVLRGLHYQIKPFEQGKLVRVMLGEIFDVAVDIRPNSNSFGKWVGVYLTSKNRKQLWIPPGFAHGFLTISNFAEVAYKTTNYWDKDSERSIKWNDSSIKIEWPNKSIELNEILLSDKDSEASLISEINLKEL